MWCDFRLGKSTEIGADADCPFCKSRISTDLIEGELAFALAGPNAGDWGRVESVNRNGGDQSISLCVNPSDLSEVTHFSKQRHLVCRLDDLRLPRWLPPLRLNYLAQFEGLIHAFSNSLEVGSSFQWSDEAAAWLVSGLWESMLPVNGDEVATAAIGHGLPVYFQSKLADYFEFGRDCLISARKRKPMPSRKKSGEVEEAFLDTLRFSYLWHNR